MKADEDRVNNKNKHTRLGVNALLYTHISLPSNDKVNIFDTLHFTFQGLTPRPSYPVSELIRTYLYVGTDEDRVNLYGSARPQLSSKVAIYRYL